MYKTKCISVVRPRPSSVVRRPSSVVDRRRPSPSSSVDVVRCRRPSSSVENHLFICGCCSMLLKFQPLTNKLQAPYVDIFTRVITCNAQNSECIWVFMWQPFVFLLIAWTDALVRFTMRGMQGEVYEFRVAPTTPMNTCVEAFCKRFQLRKLQTLT